VLQVCVVASLLRGSHSLPHLSAPPLSHFAALSQQKVGRSGKTCVATSRRIVSKELRWK